MQPDSTTDIGSSTPVTIPAAFLNALPVLKQTLGVDSDHVIQPAILRTLLVYCDGRILVSRTTDLEVETVYKHTLSEPIVEFVPFTVAIPFATFSRATGKSKHVTLTVNADLAIVTADGAVTTIPLLAASAYPPPARLRFGAIVHSATMPASAFITAFGRAAAIAGNDQNRDRAMLGTLLEFGPPPPTMRLQSTVPGMTFTATDGHRLVQSFTPATVLSTGQTSDEPSASIIGPAAFGGALRKLKLPKSSDDVSATLTVSANAIRFVGGDYTIIARRIHAPYPSYRQIFPSPNADLAYTVDRKPFIKAVKAAASVSTDVPQKVTFVQTGPNVDVTSKSHNSDFSQHVDVTSNRDGFTTAFSGMSLVNLLDLFTGNQLTIEQLSPLTPATIIEKSADASMIALMMPMRL